MKTTHHMPQLCVKQVLSVHFGAVPTPEVKFEWAFTDKHKAFKREEHTPLGFYRDVVPTKVDEMVSIINDPRNPYHKYVPCQQALCWNRHLQCPLLGPAPYSSFAGISVWACQPGIFL